MPDAILPPHSIASSDTRALALDVAALAHVTALAAAILGLTAEDLRRRLTSAVEAAPLTVPPSPADEGPPPLISEDEFGAWSRTLIDRRSAENKVGARRCAS